MCFSTVVPFTRLSVFIAKLSERQCCWRVFEDFHSQEYIQFFDIHCCLFMRLPLLHWRLWLSLDFTISSKYPFQHHSSPFLLIICIERAGVDNKFPFFSGLRVDAGKHLVSEGEKNTAFIFLFWFYNTFGQPPRCFTGPSLLPLCLLLSPILKFWSVGAALMRFTWANISERRILSRILLWRAIAFVTFTRWIGFCMSELFRKIEVNFGGSMSWNTQPNCRVLDE